MRVNKKAILDTIEWAKTALANGMRVPPVPTSQVTEDILFKRAVVVALWAFWKPEQFQRQQGAGRWKAETPTITKVLSLLQTIDNVPVLDVQVDNDGMLHVKLKILKRSAGEVGTTLTLFHGSPYSNVDVSEAPLLYYTANIEIARDYALGTVAFTGKPPKGVHTEHGPTVYKVKAAGLHVFDFRRTDHQELYQHLQEDFNKRLTEDENDSRRPRLWLPPLDSEGFIMNRTGLPSYGHIRVLIPLIKKHHFDAIWIDEGSQGTSIAIFNPRKVQLQDRVQLKRRT